MIIKRDKNDPILGSLTDYDLIMHVWDATGLGFKLLELSSISYFCKTIVPCTCGAPNCFARFVTVVYLN